MTIATQVVKANTVAALETAVNAILATWVAGTSRFIIGFDIIMNDSDRLLGTEYQAVITTDDTGATAQADPFVLHVVQEKSPTALEAALDAEIATAATAFWTGARIISQDNVSRINMMTSWLVSAAVASIVAATANWVPR